MGSGLELFCAQVAWVSGVWDQMVWSDVLDFMLGRIPSKLCSAYLLERRVGYRLRVLDDVVCLRGCGRRKLFFGRGWHVALVRFRE